jgi:hypothetical protein
MKQMQSHTYTIFWRDAAKTWNNFYIECARNASEITNIGQTYFQNPGCLVIKGKISLISLRVRVDYICKTIRQGNSYFF